MSPAFVVGAPRQLPAPLDRRDERNPATTRGTAPAPALEDYKLILLGILIDTERFAGPGHAPAGSWRNDIPCSRRALGPPKNAVDASVGGTIAALRSVH